MMNIFLFEGPDYYFEEQILNNNIEHHNSKRIYFRDIIKLIDKVLLDSVVNEIKSSMQEQETDYFSIVCEC